MTAAVFFQDQEADYLKWLAAHPEGWVLNTNARPNPRYLILHRAHCSTISQYRQEHLGKPAFTGGRYAKAAADDPLELLSWVKRHGFDTVTGYCSKCGTSEDSLALSAAPSHGNPPEPADDSRGADDARREAQVRVRRGQAKFRKQLLKAYERCCAVTGTKVEPLLEAAHIAPHALETDYRVSNGLLLRADIHTLFDLHHLSVDASGRIHLSAQLQASEYRPFHGKMIRLPADAGKQPSTSARQARHDRFLEMETQRVATGQTPGPMR